MGEEYGMKIIWREKYGARMISVLASCLRMVWVCVCGGGGGKAPLAPGYTPGCGS